MGFMNLLTNSFSFYLSLHCINLSPLPSFHDPFYYYHHPPSPPSPLFSLFFSFLKSYLRPLLLFLRQHSPVIIIIHIIIMIDNTYITIFHRFIRFSHTHTSRVLSASHQIDMHYTYLF